MSLPRLDIKDTFNNSWGCKKERIWEVPSKGSDSIAEYVCLRAEYVGVVMVVRGELGGEEESLVSSAVPLASLVVKSFRDGGGDRSRRRLTIG